MASRLRVRCNARAKPSRYFASSRPANDSPTTAKPTGSLGPTAKDDRYVHSLNQ